MVFDAPLELFFPENVSVKPRCERPLILLKRAQADEGPANEKTFSVVLTEESLRLQLADWLAAYASKGAR